MSSFVLAAALKAAEASSAAKPGMSTAEIMAIVKAAQEEVRAANPTSRNLLEELLAERRAEAAGE